MAVLEAKAQLRGKRWFVKCPECETRFELDTDPAPGGMEANIEFCPECGAYIEVQP